jgi:hypothetical protein
VDAAARDSPLKGSPTCSTRVEKPRDSTDRKPVDATAHDTAQVAQPTTRASVREFARVAGHFHQRRDWLALFPFTTIRHPAMSDPLTRPSAAAAARVIRQHHNSD